MIYKSRKRQHSRRDLKAGSKVRRRCTNRIIFDEDDRSNGTVNSSTTRKAQNERW